MAEINPRVTPRHLIGAEADILSAFYPVPGLGLIPINAFVLRAQQPVIVDTGAIVFREAFLAGLRQAIDLAEVRWIYLTHADPDHVGCLRDVLAEAPNAKIVTTFFGLGKLGLYGPVPSERVYLLNPGQTLDVGDRELRVLRPITFDAPETTAFVYTKTGVLFSADSFGAIVSEVVEQAADVPSSALRDGIVTWASVDSPWLPALTAETFAKWIAAVRDIAPRIVLSAHLPPAIAMTDTLLDAVAAAPSAPPFVGPDQKAMMAMLAAMAKPQPETVHA